MFPIPSLSVLNLIRLSLYPPLVSGADHMKMLVMRSSCLVAFWTKKSREGEGEYPSQSLIFPDHPPVVTRVSITKAVEGGEENEWMCVS